MKLLEVMIGNTCVLENSIMVQKNSYKHNITSWDMVFVEYGVNDAYFFFFLNLQSNNRSIYNLAYSGLS